MRLPHEWPNRISFCLEKRWRSCWARSIPSAVSLSSVTQTFAKTGAAGAARGVAKIDDQVTGLANSFEGTIECRYGCAVSQRVVEANVANARADLGCFQRRRLTRELIGCRQLDRTSRARFADLKPPRRIVATRQHGSQGPIPRSRDRVVVPRAPSWSPPRRQRAHRRSRARRRQAGDRLVPRPSCHVLG